MNTPLRIDVRFPENAMYGTCLGRLRKALKAYIPYLQIRKRANGVLITGTAEKVAASNSRSLYVLFWIGAFAGEVSLCLFPFAVQDRLGARPASSAFCKTTQYLVRYHILCQALAKSSNEVTRCGSRVGPNSQATVAAKAATSTIPIVFITGVDPVQLGWVASLNRPGGNLTGVTSLDTELGRKRLELLHELLPKAGTIAALVNPTFPGTDIQVRELEAAASMLGRKLHVMHASTEPDINIAFASLTRLQVGGLVIANDAFLASQSVQLAGLAVRHAVPAISPYGEFAKAGGLMSYATSLADLYRLMGVHTGRILKGEKPADLPVQQPTKFELIINLKAAKALDLTVPLPLSGLADELIE